MDRITQPDFEKGLKEIIQQGIFYHYSDPTNIDHTFSSKVVIEKESLLEVFLSDGSHYRIKVMEA